jgi:hypothetical protein
MQHAELMVVPAGMNSKCSMPLMSQKAVSMTLFAVLNFYGADQ